MKTLLIVESPAKSKTIEKLLGNNYIVLSSYGHIRNLDSKNLGIDIDNNFEPNYKIMSSRLKEIKKIQTTMKTVDRVLLASDEDREGEAIAWHCAQVFKLNINEKNRICFHEITKKALENAISNPRQINMNMVGSQQARRILDRIVGFKLSPLLWKYIAPKLSAGRVQSAALKIITDKEKEIQNFIDHKEYKILGIFNKKITASLNKTFEKEEDGLLFLNDCKTAIFKIKNIEKKKNEIRPPPPYITSTIQQDAGLRYGIPSKKIMSILQNLYEQGYITYHRTDSTLLSTDIQNEIKDYITKNYGTEYVHPRIYKSKIKCAQEAHEAIRPTHIDQIGLNDTFDELDKKIYTLIWKRTVSSQMSSCLIEIYNVIISISNNENLFLSKTQKILFDGYRKIYEECAKEDDENELNNDHFIIENIVINDILKYQKINCLEKYKNPPLRFQEASLVKNMEKVGIGRPSTYANTIEILIDRKYVEKKNINGIKIDTTHHILEKNNITQKIETILHGAEKKKMVPTQLGLLTIDFLIKHFENILNSNFTSQLEEKLDNIVNDSIVWNNVVKEFYEDFEQYFLKLKDNKIDNNEKKRFLGMNEEGKNVYTYIGKYGPVIQIGEKKDSKYIKLDDNYNINDVKLEDLNKIQKYPMNIGVYKDHQIIIKKGIYGYYINYNNKNIKILEHIDAENISLHEAISCIENIVVDNDLIKKIDDYIIKNGKYGPYIFYKKKFYPIPKNYNPVDLNEITIKEIINKKKNNLKK